MTAVPDPSPRPVAPDPLDEAFAVADRLAVHGSDCVCPPCAGRLPGLLRELARALDTADRHPGAGRGTP